MTAAMLERPALASSPCRFPDWCNGSCHVQVTGERNHWSFPKEVEDVETFDTVGVELYEYEGPGYENLAVVVCLALGDGAGGTASTTFPTARARQLGNVLLAFRPKDHPYSNAMLWHDIDDEGKHAPYTYIELRQPRERRYGDDSPMTIEVSIREGATRTIERTQLNLLDARTLGRWLVEAADQAETSNLKYGLVDEESAR